MPNQLAFTTFQTPASDTPTPGTLSGAVTALVISDPTENEVTSLIELDEPWDVRVDWQLTGTPDNGFTPLVGGYWLVELFSDDIDGVGKMLGSLAHATIQIFPGSSPLKFSQTFHIPASRNEVGVYQLTVTINHSTDGNPHHQTEMVGFAESTPMKITETDVE